MGLPVVKVATGGLAITQAAAFGVAMEIAANGYGTPVTVVASGGLPVTDVGAAGGIFASINLTSAFFSAGAAQGTAIGTLSVTGGTGTYTFTLTDSAGNRVQVAGTNGVNLQVGATASPSVTTFPITVQANNGAGSVISQTFTITVNPAAGSVFLKEDMSAPTTEWWGFW